MQLGQSGPDLSPGLDKIIPTGRVTWRDAGVTGSLHWELATQLGREAVVRGQSRSRVITQSLIPLGTHSKDTFSRCFGLKTLQIRGVTFKKRKKLPKM